MKINDILSESRWDRRDAYQRDYDSSQSGFGRGHRDMSDESNLLYIYKNERVMQRMVGNHEERQARAEGYCDTPEQALRKHNIIRSKFDPKKWVQKHGDKWVQVYPFGKPELEEDGEFAGANGPVSVNKQGDRTIVQRKEWDQSTAGSGGLTSGNGSAPSYGMPGFGGTRDADYDSGDYSDDAMNETIVKKGSKYEVQSKTGKNLGQSDTKAGAVKRLGQVEWFKKHK
jgi:hypothetical protein